MSCERFATTPLASLHTRQRTEASGRAIRLVVVDDTRVARPEVTLGDIASTIVHEATHARLERMGIAYKPDRRLRIEQACYRRQLAFVRNLPDHARLAEMVEAQIASPGPESDYSWEGYNARIIAELRRLGMPRWFTRAMQSISWWRYAG